jgi:hypothetical protein
MKINAEFFGLLQEQNILKTTKTKPIVGAIQDRHPVTFYYSGPYKPKNDSVKRGTRFEGEPVALGLSKKGNLIVRMFIPSPNVSKKGFDKTSWRTFMVSRMSNVQIVNDKTFEKRPGYKEGDESKAGPMQITYVTTDWGKKPEISKGKKIKPSVEPTKKVEPTVKPTKKVEPTINPTIEPTKKIEPTIQPKELPQIKSKTKPEPITSPEKPVIEPKTEPNKINGLQQIKPQNKPSKNPEDSGNKNIQEEMKRIKSLISY